MEQANNLDQRQNHTDNSAKRHEPLEAAAHHFRIPDDIAQQYAWKSESKVIPGLQTYENQVTKKEIHISHDPDPRSGHLKFYSSNDHTARQISGDDAIVRSVPANYARELERRDYEWNSRGIVEDRNRERNGGKEPNYTVGEQQRHYTALEKHLHVDDAKHFGWAQENGTVQTYQHAYTQRHIHIDGPTGQFFSQDKQPISKEAALDRAMGVGNHHAVSNSQIQEQPNHARHAHESRSTEPASAQSVAATPSQWVKDYKAAVTPEATVEPVALDRGLARNFVTLALDSEPARLKRLTNLVGHGTTENAHKDPDSERHYAPLKQQLNPDDARHFAWKAENGTVQTYQHAETRRHIHVDGSTGQFFSQDKQPITREAALDRAMGAGNHHAVSNSQAQETAQQRRVDQSVGFGL